MSLKKIYLIGGSGYIGSVVADYLNEKYFKSYKIIIIDKKIYKNQNYTSKKVKTFKYSLNEMIKKIKFVDTDIIIFLAGLVGDPITKKYKKISRETNFKQTKDCIDFLIRNKVNRILFVSTCSNYGLSGKKSLKESSKLSPLSYYAKDKVKN